MSVLIGCNNDIWLFVNNCSINLIIKPYNIFLNFEICVYNINNLFGGCYV